MKSHLQGDDLVRALKARADELQAADGRAGIKTKRGAALNTASRDLGFRDWNTASAHAKATQRTTAGAHPQLRQLPAELIAILDDEAAAAPASAETQRAFDEGFVFAMDVKDGQQVGTSDLFVPADDGWHVAARDLWTELVHEVDFETEQSLLESMDLPQLAEVARDDVLNYSLFRFTGASAPETLSDAYALINKISFFAPTHMWLGGKFINLSKVPEIRVDGEVVYSTTQPGMGTEAPAGTDAEKLWHLLNEEERKLFRSMSPAEQSFMLHQAKKRTPYGSSRYQQVQASFTLK